MGANSNEQKTVLLGVTGGIAAYKACEILRGFQKAGLRVKVMMTQSATRFIDPLTFRALSHDDVAVDLFDNEDDPIPHITLSKECDLLLIAPCTANVMAKVANGIADDLLTATTLACTSPIMIAPAMNVNMYMNSATVANMKTLKERGFEFIEPVEGHLACGDEGKGKLAEADQIVSAAVNRLSRSSDLAGIDVLVTAGPTVEQIDPVRFISNSSSGKMGYAIAEEAAKRGAHVTLISGPVSIDAPARMDVVNVRTAEEMLQACSSLQDHFDLGIFTAAVADMRPEMQFDHKLKKGTDDEALSAVRLVKNPDILATIASKKRPGQHIVGFAAETDDVVENARKKLSAKNADLVVANEVGIDKTFGKDVDEVHFVSDAGVIDLPELSKQEVAKRLIDYCLENFLANS